MRLPGKASIITDAHEGVGRIAQIADGKADTLFLAVGRLAQPVFFVAYQGALRGNRADQL